MRPESLVLYDSENESQARALAERLGFAVCSSDDPTMMVSRRCAQLRLVCEDHRWQIILPNSQARASVDFSNARLLHRLQQGIKRERVVKAVLGRRSAADTITVVDATAGFGVDAWMLAAAGCQVTMIEREPLLQVLLEQGLVQLAETPMQALQAIAGRLSLVSGESIEHLQAWSRQRPDVVYLDPMFQPLRSDPLSAQAEASQHGSGGVSDQQVHGKKPKNKRSAAVKKQMALLQWLTERKPVPASEDSALMQAALTLAEKKVVVKRATAADYFAGQKPSASLPGKTARFDIYLPSGSM